MLCGHTHDDVHYVVVYWECFTEKFLVDHKGVVRYRYPDKWEPEEIRKDIEALMREA